MPAKPSRRPATAAAGPAAPAQGSAAAARCTGAGATEVAASPRARLERYCSTRRRSHAIIPGCRTASRRYSDTDFRADVTLGVGPVKRPVSAPTIKLSDLDRAESRDAVAAARRGALGSGAGQGPCHADAGEASGHAELAYDYEARDRRQGRLGRRPPARRRRARRDRPVLRGAGRARPAAAACREPALLAAPARAVRRARMKPAPFDYHARRDARRSAAAARRARRRGAGSWPAASRWCRC